MRALPLVLLLVVAGCAHRGAPPPDVRVMPDDFAGTVVYENDSVPHHYRWTVTFNHTTATLSWRPGHDDALSPWQKTVDITADQRSRLYERLVDLDVFDLPDVIDKGMVGGQDGRYEFTARGETYAVGTFSGNEENVELVRTVAGAAEDLVPADVWHDMQYAQDEWEARQPK